MGRETTTNIRELKIITGINIYRAILLLITFLFYIVSIDVIVSLITKKYSSDNSFLCIISLIITICSILLIIFAEKYVTKVFPFLFKNLIVINENNITCISKKGIIKKSFYLDEIILTYYDIKSSPDCFLGCFIFTNKQTNNYEYGCFITNKQSKLLEDFLGYSIHYRKHSKKIHKK